MSCRKCCLPTWERPQLVPLGSSSTELTQTAVTWQLHANRQKRLYNKNDTSRIKARKPNDVTKQRKRFPQALCGGWELSVFCCELKGARFLRRKFLPAVNFTGRFTLRTRCSCRRSCRASFSLFCTLGASTRVRTLLHTCA